MPTNRGLRRWALGIGGIGLGVLGLGCGSAVEPSVGSSLIDDLGSQTRVGESPGSGRPAIVFRAQELLFQYDRGATGLALPVEPVGGGIALLDFDGDGRLDLFFAQGGPLTGRVESLADGPADVLLRNEGNGRFVDVSAEVGLVPRGYGLGVTVADFDGDGYPDVYVTRYGRNTLWKNLGGRFVDQTAEAGVGCELWSLGAVFFDFDGDGHLDLFVANYFDFDPALAPFARDPVTGAPDFDLPTAYSGLPDVLYRNNGDGTFTDVTEKAGVAGRNRGMGVLAFDFNNDGWMDLLVANDAEPNTLWRNRGDGTFEDLATTTGIAVNGRGMVEADMGIARGDTDGDGRPDILITHYFAEHDTLWRSVRSGDGSVFFLDSTYPAGLGSDTLSLTGWGTALADFDQDGHLDLIVTNGHIRPEPHQVYRYENPPILWRNLGNGRFENVTATAGPYFLGLHQGRGLACGDLNGNGALDVVIVHHHAPAVVLWNETPAPGHWLMLDLQGAGPNRDAIGAEVKALLGDRVLLRAIDGGGSYISAHDRRIHLGLGSSRSVDRLEVRWPSGRIESRANVAAGTVVRWVESP